ncbi:unnamed protein product [Nippostrongylus brasiliensis]|uniref:RanBD1 domain-containing protein n=1 Tax=Nippostrongylus brasiliensis TaxID=27835 RepID=A0A158R2F2_NIPBR|nr:unnamed protein product [Nippostrongylus brasiliensis]
MGWTCVRVWLDVIMSEHSNRDSEAPPAKKMFAFRQSALSAKADQLWSQSKSGFGFGVTPSTHVQLEKKSLDDVLGKMAAEKKLRQEQEGKSQPVFVFGSKISERVVKEDKECTSTNGTSSTDADGESAKPKTAEELFKSAAQQDKHEEHDFIAEAKEAAEKKKEHDKPSTSIVTVTTGEENDINIFQTACKLHSFDKEKKTWVERGLAQIKINQRNEDGEVHHRIGAVQLSPRYFFFELAVCFLVFPDVVNKIKPLMYRGRWQNVLVARTTGNHRVVINSRVHADMFFERVDQKRLKISATTPDSTAIQIFLVTIGFSKTALNIDEFCATLEGILKKEKASESSKRKRKAEDEPGVDKVARLNIEENTSSSNDDGLKSTGSEESTKEKEEVAAPEEKSENDEAEKN